MNKYNLSVPDFKEHQDAGPWRSYELVAEGDTLKELLKNAAYIQVDQDGGDLGYVPADDDAAQAYIQAWFEALKS